MGVEAGIQMHGDASSAIALSLKDGLTGMRHMDTKYVWLQDKVGKGLFTIPKIKGAKNPSDI